MGCCTPNPRTAPLGVMMPSPAKTRHTPMVIKDAPTPQQSHLRGARYHPPSAQGARHGFRDRNFLSPTEKHRLPGSPPTTWASGTCEDAPQFLAQAFGKNPDSWAEGAGAPALLAQSAW